MQVSSISSVHSDVLFQFSDSIPQESTSENDLLKQILQTSLTLPTAATVNVLEEKKVFNLLTVIDEDYLEKLLSDQKEMEKLAESLSDLDAEWTLIEDSGEEEKQKASWLNSWAITGGIPLLSATVGTMQQMMGSQLGFSVLQGINLLKQIEIKNCAYVLPTAPLFIDLASKVYQDDSQDPFPKKVMKAVAGMDKKEVAFTLVSCGLSLTTAGMHGALLKAGMLTFDLSGHIMTKTVSSAILAKGLKSDETTEKASMLKKAAAYTYIASDALMLHKTAMRFHTPEETLAGAIWGLVNISVAHVLANKLTENPVSTPLEIKTEEDQELAVKYLTEQPLTIIEDYQPKSTEEEEVPAIL